MSAVALAKAGGAEAKRIGGVMPEIIIDRNHCKGCETCTDACPQQILGMSKKINVKGYFPAEVIDPVRCIGCRICGIVCPDMAIEVHTNGVQYHLFEY
ncbi:MAG: 4Fe-4S dicluster domain-containing protein [Planctomycetota bacterium]